jgi:hypothetical protein
MTQQQWMRQHDGQPVTLLLSCRVDDDYRRELPYDVQVAPRRTGTGTGTSAHDPGTRGATWCGMLPGMKIRLCGRRS